MFFYSHGCVYYFVLTEFIIRLIRDYVNAIKIQFSGQFTINFILYQAAAIVQN